MKENREVEIWKDIELRGVTYRISNHGRLSSIDRVVQNTYMSKLGKIVCRSTQYRGKILKLSVNRSGYAILKTNYGVIRIHRQVALNFVSGYEVGKVVDHIDEDKTNNYFKNLEWVSRSYNGKIRDDCNRVFGKGAKRFEGTILAIDSNGEVVDRLQGNKDMKDKGYDYRNVSAVLLGKRCSHRGCTFIKLCDGVERSVGGTLTVANFKPIQVLDPEGNHVCNLMTYKSITEQGFVVQRVQQVLSGTSKTHKGLIFKFM